MTSVFKYSSPTVGKYGGVDNDGIIDSLENSDYNLVLYRR